MGKSGRKKIVIDADKLILLRDGGLSNEEIAAAFKCSVPTVANRTRELQLQGLIKYKRRAVKAVKHIPRAELAEAAENMTLKNLARHFDVSHSTVRKRLDEYNIQTRSMSVIDRMVNDVRTLSSHKTRAEIASEIGVGLNSVEKCCRKYNIRCKNAHQNMTNAKLARRDAIIALSGQSNWTKSEIALAFNISRERVRQIIARTDYSNSYAAHDDTTDMEDKVDTEGS